MRTQTFLSVGKNVIIMIYPFMILIFLIVSLQIILAHYVYTDAAM